MSVENQTKKSRKIQFPGRHQNGARKVYQKGTSYRDNSPYLEVLMSHDSNALCFTRPMQLGKTILFSLANELFSANEASNVDNNLAYSPGEGDRNKWHVLGVNFGTIRGTDTSVDTDGKWNEQKWKKRCESLDKATVLVIKQSVLVLLKTNDELEKSFDDFSMGTKLKEQAIGAVISCLYLAVSHIGGKLLILVDEYDKPIRESLLELILIRNSDLYETVKDAITTHYANYFGFFSAVKVALEHITAKIWLTGITPIGIKEMSGLNVIHVSFVQGMADAVGLTEDHIENMLDEVDSVIPFQNGERDKATNWLSRSYNNLHFPSGSPLYHTGLINGIMNALLEADSVDRTRFLQNGQLPINLQREPVSTSIFNVLSHARNLRPVVNKIVNGVQVDGYELNGELSLEHLLKETVDVGDYLTLLVHVGVVSVDRSGTTTKFSCSSQYYRQNLLDPLLATLQTSLVTILSCTSKQDLYEHGEDILEDFVTSISERNMTKLMAWAASDEENNILELQFQSHVVSEAHDILNGVADTTREGVLPATGKRTDVTFSSKTCVVILELKQLRGDPTATFMSNAHKQLAEYVCTRERMENLGDARPVAGFVVVMCNNGDGYVVEKLANEYP